MSSYENTFIRGPSPSYTDEAPSENALPVEVVDPISSTDNFLEEKFNCGYDAEPLTSPLKQGRKTFAFWTIVTILLILTVGNLILTLIIIGVLHLGKGIHGMEMIPEEDAIKFYGSTDLDRIYSKQSGQIEGFSDVPVTISADDGGFYVRLHRNGQAHNRILMDKSGIQFRAVNSFEIKDPKDSGNTIFTTHRPHYNMPEGGNALVAKAISASRITSPIGQPLHMESDSRVSFRGSEGISLDASSILLQAEHNILINSTQGAISLEAGAGIFLDMDKIPVVSSEFGLRTGSVQYKICVCMPKGTLFRIPVPSTPRVHNGPKITCGHFSAKHDPCAAN